MTSVVVTGAGAPGIAGTIYSLKNNPDKVKFRIITTDIKHDPVGKYLSDRFYKVPSPEDKAYIQRLKEIAEKEGVEAVIPQTTRELVSLSQRREEFMEMGVSIVVSGYDSVKRANDKYLIIKECEKADVPFPRYFLVDSKKDFLASLDRLGYPESKVVIKPRLSSGLRGVRVITDDVLTMDKFLNEKPSGLEIDLESILRIFGKNNFPELLVTEYMPGEEYTVDVFRNRNGAVAIPRIRKSIRSGISFDTQIDLQEDIIRYSIKLADSLNLEYCFGFQFKQDQSNVPKILEANPRVQGTMVASTFAGFNMIYYAVKEALGHDTDTANIKLSDKIQIKRYWGAVTIKNEKFFERI